MAMIPRAALAVAAILSSAAFAAPLTDAERETIAAAARASPTGWGSQETVNLVNRLATEGNLEGLDLLLSLKHAPLLGVYANRYREAHKKDDPAPIEQRLVPRYDDDPRVAIALMQALDRYKSKPLFEKMLRDASSLAKVYADEAKRCRYVDAAPPAAAAPGTAARPEATPGGLAPAPMPGRVGSGMGSAIMAQSVSRPPRIECDGGPQWVTQERYRMAEAVRMIGRTEVPDASRHLQPLFVPLTAYPTAGEEKLPATYGSPIGGRVRDLHSIVELWGRERYVKAGAELAAVARRMPPRSLLDASAAWPLLKALGQMDLREGSATIAEWIDRRSSMPATLLNQTPTLVETIYLLGPVLPEGQIDIAPLRDRVLERLPAQNRNETATAFGNVETMNRNLRDPKEATLVSWARANNPRMVRYVLSRGVTPNARDAEGETALTATRSYFEMQKLLVEAGADPDLPGRDGMTPFHQAVAWFSPNAPEPYKTVDYFYSKKPDVNRAAGQGTPLATAAERSPEMVKYLLDRGARVDIPTRDGLTPLHLAARGAKAENVRMLLAAGASARAKDRGGMTPLHYAVGSRNVEIAGLLIERGADVNAEIQEGMTPLQMAQDGNDSAMQALLERHGARVNVAYAAKRAAMKKQMEEAYRAR
jgi:ankyrin repeat protein